MNEDHLLHAVFVGVYLAALIGVGALKARKIKSQEDFSLAGRGLSTFVLVGTLLATWIGTGSIIGNAGETYRVGAAAFLLPIASCLGIVILYCLAGRIRGVGQFTIQDILEQRYGPTARVIGTVTLVTAYVMIVANQYRAGSMVLGFIYPDLDETSAKALVAVFVIAYTALAGMFSVAYTDVANGILITLGVFIAIPILLSKLGGFSGIQETLTPEQLDLLGTFSWTDIVNNLLPAFLLILGDANMYQRFFSARNAVSAKRAAIWMFVGVLVLECAIIGLGLLGRAMHEQGQISAPVHPSGNPGLLGDTVVLVLAFEGLPAFLGAMMVGTVVAIIVSTADSYLLAPATSLVRDVYQRFLRKDASERQLVSAGRWIVIALGIVAFGLTFTSSNFFRFALFSYTVYGASITVPLLAAFLWKRATPAGAVSALIGGAGTAVLWRYVLRDVFRAAAEGSPDGSLWRTLGELAPVLPAILVNVLLLVVVSLMTKPRPTP